MRRLMILVTIVVLMTAMLAPPALSRATTTPCELTPEGCTGPFGGTPLPTVVCDVVGGDSAIIGWREGTCWVFHPVPVVSF
jgi:hypothetical protein